MSTIIFKYPLDLLGTSPGNRVDDEEYEIGAVRRRIFIPTAPFFGNSASLVDLETNRPLLPKIDYYLVHDYEEARERTAQPVYAAVRIVNPEVSTRIGFSGQYVGGEFSYSYAALVQAILDLQNDQRPIHWGDLIGLPALWAPTPHSHDVHDTFNWNSMVNAQNRTVAAILEGNTASQNLLIQTLSAQIALMEQYRDQNTAAFNAFRQQVNQTVADIRFDPPIGFYYTQYAGGQPPAALFGGGWEVRTLPGAFGTVWEKTLNG